HTRTSFGSHLQLKHSEKALPFDFDTLHCFQLKPTSKSVTHQSCLDNPENMERISSCAEFRGELHLVAGADISYRMVLIPTYSGYYRYTFNLIMSAHFKNKNTILVSGIRTTLKSLLDHAATCSMTCKVEENSELLISHNVF